MGAGGKRVVVKGYSPDAIDQLQPVFQSLKRENGFFDGFDINPENIRCAYGRRHVLEVMLAAKRKPVGFAETLPLQKYFPAGGKSSVCRLQSAKKDNVGLGTFGKAFGNFVIGVDDRVVRFFLKLDDISFGLNVLF